MAWNLAEIPQIPCNDRSGPKLQNAISALELNCNDVLPPVTTLNECASKMFSIIIWIIYIFMILVFITTCEPTEGT
jgi:hypothetical protein